MSHLRNLFHKPAEYKPISSPAPAVVQENFVTSGSVATAPPALPDFPVEEVQLRPEDRLVYYAEPRSPAADRFRLLRMKLKKFWAAGKLKKLLITSALARDGKSTLVLNLATALAERGKHTVLVVESDLHHSSLTEILRLKPWAGLTDCLASDATPPLSAIRRIEPLGWYLLPAGE